MPNPLKVSLENIIPLTEARDHFSQIVNEVQKDKLYVLTKGGKPAVAIVDVKYLEAITGGNVNQDYVKEEIKKAPEKVGLAPMVEHKPLPTPPLTTPISSLTIPPTPKPFNPITPPSPTPPSPVIPASPTPKPPIPSGATPTTPPINTLPPARQSQAPGVAGGPNTPLPPPKSPTPPSTMPARQSQAPGVAGGPNPTNSSTGTPTSPVQSAPTPPASPPIPPNNAVIETSINPFDTKQQTVQAVQPVQPAQTTQPTPISVNFSPDYNEKETKKPGEAAPEDKPGPAQYSGSSTAAGADAPKEPDDMAID